MASTDIEWATKVWNFVRGCRRVSPGCGGAAGVGGCYAESQANRFKGPGQPYEGLVQLGKQGPRWTGVGRFVPEKLGEPLSWRRPRDGTRHRVFVNSMSDLFFEEFTNEQIAAGFGVMAACPEHDFLILTKRAERMREWFRWIAREASDPLGPPAPVICGIHAANACADVDYLGLPATWPLPNVWLGVSCEDQQRADERIPHLLACPAAVRFLSVEPMLGPVDLHVEWLAPFKDVEPNLQRTPRVDWVIVGGESGPGARLMLVEWARSIVAQCKSASVPVFVKQLGAKPHHLVRDYTYCAEEREDLEPLRLLDRKGGDPSEWPEDLRVRQFPDPSKAAELPEVE